MDLITDETKKKKTIMLKGLFTEAQFRQFTIHNNDKLTQLTDYCQNLEDQIENLQKNPKNHEQSLLNANQLLKLESDVEERFSNFNERLINMEKEFNGESDDESQSLCPEAPNLDLADI